MSKKETAIIILAAGKGTRMHSSLPKVLHEIAGRRMIDHVLNTSLSITPTPGKIVCVLGKSMSDIQKAIQLQCTIAIQQEQKGTADAVKSALPHLEKFNGNVVILYADTPLITHETVELMLKKIDDKTAICALGFQSQNPTGYGRFIGNNNRLNQIVEEKDANEDQKKITLCNSGILAVNGKYLASLLADVSNHNAKQEFYLTDIIQIANNKGYHCTYHEGEEAEVLGVNDRVQLAKAEQIYQERIRNNMMKQGVTLIDPDTVYFSADTQIGQDTIIHPNVFIGPNVTLEDEVTIFPFSHIAGATIGKKTTIGPFARIRQGTTINNNVRIGNFVEIKKSNIHEDVKLGHLSYIGDTIIGKNTNVGAGTITCNYDGFNKYKTEIGSHVFIGSHSSLVAPIKIGDNALIAAGSTITDNVEPDALSIARSKQQVKKDGGKKFRKNKQK